MISKRSVLIYYKNQGHLLQKQEEDPAKCDYKIIIFVVTLKAVDYNFFTATMRQNTM